MAVPGPARPRVSILLPTYNRAHFLPMAVESIQAQTFRDWELVIIDDGSTDDTTEVVSRLRRAVSQPVTFVAQPNAGAYRARNRALELATAPYLAFFDSDDFWLPHHLENSVSALEAHPELDWVYSACRIIDFGSGKVLEPDTFMVNGSPRPFRALHAARDGRLSVIDDARVVECAIRHGLYCGLQNSVIRDRVFASERFHWSYCEEPGVSTSAASSRSAEDQLFAIRSLKRGCRMGYIDDVHVLYHVHDANSSASAAATRDLERLLLTLRPVVRGFEELQREILFTTRERRALRRRLSREYFWHTGYAAYWMHGRPAEAIQAFHEGLRLWPSNLAYWKTYGLARLRAALRRPNAPDARDGA